MIRIPLIIFSLLLFVTAKTQTHNSSIIFAHNDYEQEVPFHTAYGLQVGFIEADVFLVDTEILVAHHQNEIQPGKTLENLYLQPLAKKIQQNEGSVYKGTRQTLTLMIDLKSEGVSTLSAVVDQIQKYPQLTSCATLHIMVSGSLPQPEKWRDYPDFISFDGRPGIPYTPSQLKRIRMISTNFQTHIKWDGSGRIPDDAEKKIQSLKEDAHAKNKMFRFWATPDFENAWKELVRMKMDVIVTDNVSALSEYLKREK